MKRSVSFVSLLIVIAMLISGCRGRLSEKSPVHLNPNMDHNPKFKAQSLSWHPPKGTVAWGDASVETGSISNVAASPTYHIYF